MNKLLVTIGVLLVTVLAALFAAPAMIDWSRYRGTFESEASHMLGRRVRVGDQVQLRLLPTPYISFDNVRVADASGRFDTPLLRMDSFRMQLSTSALLSGSLVAQTVELTAPTLRLAIGKDGKGSWDGLLPAVHSGTPAGQSGESQGLAVSAVHITHGVVDLVGPSEGQQWRLEDVTGNVDAAGPQGPFRFKGAFSQDGKPAELRLSIGRDDAAGALRLKATVHGANATAASYTFDGAIDAHNGQTTLIGDLDGKLPLLTGAGGGLDLKAKVSATGDYAKLDDIEIAFDAPGRPQRVTGSAVIGLTADVESQASLKSTWLDLDQIAKGAAGTPSADAAAASPRPSPKDSVQGLLALVNGLPGLGGNAHLQMALDETVFGGGPVNAVTVSVSRNLNGLALESLTAKLPGQSLISASGDVNTLGAPHFDGQVRLWGANLASMANWAAPALALKESQGASPFLIDTKVAIDAARFSAEQLRAEVAGTTVTGAIRYVASPQSLSITLDSNRLDLARDFDSPINLAALAGLAGPSDGPAAAPGDAAALDLRSLLTGDTYLDLRIGRLLTAQGELHDVSAKFDRSHGRLNIPGIDLATGDGVTLHVEGAMLVKDGQGQGQLRLLIAAPTSEAVFGALKIAGLADSPAALKKPLAALTPLVLAGTAELGGKSSAGAALALDGSAAGSRLRLRLRRDAGEGEWLSSQLDAAAELSNPNAEQLLLQIARALDRLPSPQAPVPATTASISILPSAAAPPGVLTLRLSGIPEDGLATRIGLATGAIDASFDGRSSYGDNQTFAADGTLAIAALDANRVVRLAGLSGLVPDQAGGLKLSGRLQRDADALAFSQATISVAGLESTGEAKLIAQPSRPRLEAHVQSDMLRLDRWLQLLTTAKAGTPRDLADGSAWPDQAFDFDVTQAVDAKITVGAKQLVLANGYILEDARLTTESAPGRMDATLAAGRGLQGDWTGHMVLEKAAAGAVLHLDGALDRARLDQLGGPQGAIPRPEGELALRVALESRGLTPRDIAGSASGKGTFALSEGALAGFSPNSIDAVARVSLADSTAPTADALGRRLAESSKAGAFAFRGAKGNLTIADGAIKFDRMLVDSAQSQLEIANRIDLAKLQLASTWRLQPKPVQVGKAPLPAVPFVYLGLIADLAQSQPAIDVADLKTDLDARRLLGEPEQSQGIWPVEGGAATAPEADNTPPVPAPVTPPVPTASVDLKGAPAALPVKSETAPTASAVAAPALVGPAIGDASATAAIAPPPDGAQPAADATGKHAQAQRARKKKVDWAASLLQGLFGN